MAIAFDLNCLHQVVAANSHYYAAPTEPLCSERTLHHHELTYICDGAGQLTENGTDYHLYKGDVLLLAGGHHPHAKLSCAPGTHAICIHISCESGDQLEGENTVSLPELIHVHGNSRTRRILEQIITVFGSKQTHKSERLGTLVNQLILNLLDATEHLQPINDIAEDLIDLVHTVPHKRFTTQELAKQYHVSTKAIDSAMRRATGMTFSKYQTNHKLEMVAMQLHIEPTIGLSELATAFAFCDEFYLSRAFKRKFGQSPTQYRKLLNAR